MSQKTISVVSVCSSKDIDVWSVAALNICKYIPATRYYLYVPDHEVGLFREKTPSLFEIIGEQAICGDLIDNLRERIAGKAEDRFGWYLQQLIKLMALYVHQADDLIIIWDADTVPLKRLSFATESNQIIHYAGSERNKPYFDAIERLLGMEPAVNYSFIAQSLAMKGAWLKIFFDEIEQRHGKPWPTAVLDSIDFHQDAGFSEYETLGTFAARRFGTEMIRSGSEWNRFGNRDIGSVFELANPTARKKLAKYDFVSFEAWDTPDIWDTPGPIWRRALRELRGRLFP